MAEGYGGFGIARTYALIFGIAYVGVSILEVALGTLEIGGVTILDFTGIQNAVHWVVGLGVLGSFFAGESAARMVARVVGIVFVVLTLLGFVAREFTGELLGFNGPEPWSYNIVHLLTAAAALFAGFFAERAYGQRPAAA